MITSAAMKSGFSGGLVVDYPNSAKAKKYYLVLEAGVRRNLGIVEVKGKSDMEEEAEQEVEDEANEAKMNKEKHQRFKKGSKKIVKRKELVMRAK
jgi:18S rRNA (guanine1575-N7)-methyltransferase